MPTAPSGVITGPAKRRHYWPRQATSLLGPTSGVITGPNKRRHYWPRQAASLLAPPSGVIIAPAKRRKYWAHIKRDKFWVYRHVSPLPPLRGIFLGTHGKNASIFFMGAPSPASGGRDFLVRISVFERPPSDVNTGLTSSGINSGFTAMFPPFRRCAASSWVPMEKMRAFFSWEPRPPQAGEGIFLCAFLHLSARQAASLLGLQEGRAGLMPVRCTRSVRCV